MLGQLLASAATAGRALMCKEVLPELAMLLLLADAA
jgi:hypothetical protein